MSVFKGTLTLLKVSQELSGESKHQIRPNFPFLGVSSVDMCLSKNGKRKKHYSDIYNAFKGHALALKSWYCKNFLSPKSNHSDTTKGKQEENRGCRPRHCTLKIYYS